MNQKDSDDFEIHGVFVGEVRLFGCSPSSPPAFTTTSPLRGHAELLMRILARSSGSSGWFMPTVKVAVWPIFNSLLNSVVMNIHTCSIFVQLIQLPASLIVVGEIIFR